MSTGRIVGLTLFVVAAAFYSDFFHVVTPTDLTRTRALKIFSELDKYFRDTGELPSSLNALTQRDPQLATTDGWGRPLQYTVSNGAITVTSFGYDGKLGGSGWNTDRSMSYYLRRPDGSWWIGTDGWVIYGRRTWF
jgi:hypothetical protein